jgi:hypothetical protein
MLSRMERHDTNESWELLGDIHDEKCDRQNPSKLSRLRNSVVYK